MGSHIRDARKTPNGKSFRYVHRWIQSLQRQGLRPEIILLEDAGNCDGCTQERKWIQEFRLNGARLTNLTDGGDGTLGYQYDRAVVEHIAGRNRLRWTDPAYRAAQISRMRGVRASSETRQKMSLAHAGITFSDQWRANISAGRIRYWETHSSPQRVLTDGQVQCIRADALSGERGILSKLAKQYSVDRKTILRIVRRETYKNVLETT